MRDLLDVSAQRVGAGTPASDPPVVLPIYGRWLAAQQTVPAPGATPLWLRTLNVDPRHRAVAGLATRVVQHEQERLMGEAWNQVGELERANRELRWAQLTRGVHRRVLVEGTTVWATTQASALPDDLLTSAFRRATRPRGPLARRMYAPPQRFIRPVVAAIVDGTIAASPPDRDPDGLFGFAATVPSQPEAGTAVRDRLRAAAGVAAQSRPHVVTAAQVRDVSATEVVVRDATERRSVSSDPRRPRHLAPSGDPPRRPSRHGSLKYSPQTWPPGCAALPRRGRRPPREPWSTPLS